MYNVQCTMYNVQCTMYNVQCEMYNVQCTIYNVQCTMYNVQCTMYNVQCIMYNVQCTMYFYVNQFIPQSIISTFEEYKDMFVEKEALVLDAISDVVLIEDIQVYNYVKIMIGAEASCLKDVSTSLSITTLNGIRVEKLKFS